MALLNSRIGKLASDYGGDLLLPLSTLASGGSKAAAAFQLVGGVIATKVLGPLSAVVPVVGLILASLRNWAQTAELVGRAMQRAAAKDVLIKQFAEITKSTAQAKQSIKELYDYASKAPFTSDSIIKGGASLQALSKGALVTKKSLELVGDVAASSGQQFSTAADAIGNLYNDLAKGAPAKEAANNLKDLGVISQSTVDQITSLQAAGAGLSATWNIAAQALSKAKGSAAGLSQTIEELQASREEKKGNILEPAGNVLNESAKGNLKAQNDLLDSIAPALSTIAQVIARVSTGFQQLNTFITETATQFLPLGKAIAIGTAALAAFSLSVISLSAIKLVSWGVETALAIAQFGKTAAGTGVTTAALTEENAALTLSYEALAVASRQAAAAMLEGNVAEAGAAAKVALAEVKTLAFGGALKGVRGLLGLVGEGVSYFAKGVAALFTGLGLVTTVLSAAAVALAVLVNNEEQAEDALKQFKDAAKAANDELAKMIDNITTAADAAPALAKAMALIAAGQKEIADAQDESNNNPVSNLFGTQNARINAAQQQIADASKARDEILRKATSPDRALSDDANTSNVNALLANQQGVMQNQLDNANPQQRAQLLAQRAQAAESERQKYQEAQQHLLNATNFQAAHPDDYGDDVHKEQQADALRKSGSEQGNIQADLLNPNLTDRQRQDLQNKLVLARAKYAAAPSLAEAAQATRQAGIASQNTGFEQAGANIEAGNSGKVLSPAAELQQSKQLAAIKSVQVDAAVANGSLTPQEAALQKTQLQTGLNRQGVQVANQARDTGFQQKISNLEAKTNLTPEEELNRQKQIVAIKKEQIEAEIEYEGLTKEAGQVEESQIDNDIKAKEKQAELDKAQADRQMRIQELNKAGVELDEQGVKLAKDKWGSLQDQADAIQQNNSLTKEQKQLQLESLKIAQEAAAAEVYRRQQGQQASGLRLQSQVAGMSGDTVGARAANAKAEQIEEENKYQQNKKGYYDQDIKSGMSQEEAAKESARAAEQDRQNDLAGKALSNLASINGPVVDSLQRVGGGGGIEASDPLVNISKAQLDALHELVKLNQPKSGKTKAY
jgi:hypothetical protein